MRPGGRLNPGASGASLPGEGPPPRTALDTAREALAIGRCSSSSPRPGCGIAEALGFTWADIDFDAGLIRVHASSPASANTRRSRPRPAGARSCSRQRSLLPQGFRAAVKRSGTTATGRLSPHSLRHGYASLLIAKGLNVVFVSRQLGHANPTITLTTNAHLFERANHAHAAREALEASHAAMAGASG